MENADENELLNLKNKLQKLNAKAEIYDKHYSNNPDSWWEKILTKSYDKAEESNSKNENINLENLGLQQISIPSTNHLILFLQGVVSGVFGNICRAKGYLSIKGTWLRFDVVDNNYSITGINQMPDSRAVFIGNYLKRSWLREVLQKNLHITPYKKIKP